MPRQHPIVSRRAVIAAMLLIAAHLAALEWVNWQNIQYDSGNILWWLVAFLVFPALALIWVLISLTRGLLGLRDSGE